jgi:hypothetical protein
LDKLGQILSLIVILGFAFCLVKVIINSVKTHKKALKELEEAVEPAPITEIEATVVKKECSVRTYGVKMPVSCKEFYITFSTFTGEIKRYGVSEELYLAVDEGTAGTIALVNDLFFDFYFKK